MAIVISAVSSVCAKTDGLTRGIGVYPGRMSESNAPAMAVDRDYRNIALHRAVYTSSSADFNLTGQLVTDGIITKGCPPSLAVTTPDGLLPLRDREKLIDGNIHTNCVLKGASTFVQFDWKGMTVDIDTLRFVGEVAYRAAEATQGYSVRVLAADAAGRWSVVGRAAADSLPGFATRQTVSSDPNKRQDAVRLPLRMVRMSVPLAGKGRWSGLRIELDMPGAVWWRLYQIDRGADNTGQKRFNMNSLRWPVRNTSWLPSEHFASVWRSATAPDGSTANRQWLYVDLGAVAQFDRINLFWTNRPAEGRVQVSDDAAHWTDVATLSGGKSRVERIRCNASGRYVRLMLTRTDESGCYALSEMQVMGRGGLHAVPASPCADDMRQMFVEHWQLSRDGSDNWIEATVPGTVLGSYMNVGAVPDNRYADNMRLISESFFNSDFWYRANIRCLALPSDGRRTYLDFDGVNWKAEVWLRGVYVGRIDGAFTRARFDVTDMLRKGDNTLMVRVIKNAHVGAVKLKTAQNTDLNGGVLGADAPTFHPAIGWDWITSTPGRNIGLWNDVRLSHDGGVRVSDPLVTTSLNLPDTLATLTLSAFVTNEMRQTRRVLVRATVGDIVAEQVVELAPMERREVVFAPEEYKQLRAQRMKLWWPNGYGSPYLYDARFEVCDAGTEISLSHVDFKAGIRQVQYAALDSCATIYVNGRRINPLGGNWGFSETNLNYRAREYDAAVRYHREMNCNMIRNWVGQIGDDEFYDACDRYGILVWQDFWLANPWDGPDPDDEKMFLDNSADLISRIRRHACVTIYVGRNEGFPPENIDRQLRAQIAALHPTLGYMPSSADLGVSGHGPYCLMPAEFYFSHQPGKLHSERGLPNVPTFESLVRMIPQDGLWPQGEMWGQHDFTMQGAQQGATFNEAVARRFGHAESARQYCQWAQWLNYDGYRAMYESAQQQRKGLLIWMSHPCWPSMVWSTYDYYLEPTAAYFGVKKACEPLHIQYNPVAQSVQVVNSALGVQRGLTARILVLDAAGRRLAESVADVDVDADVTADVAKLPECGDGACFLRLELADGDILVSDNFYWLDATEATWRKIKSLGVPQLSVSTDDFVRCGDEWHGSVAVANTSDVPALMLRVNLKGDDGEQILPVVYSDNYFCLLPGESRRIEVTCRVEDCRGAGLHVEVLPLN